MKIRMIISCCFLFFLVIPRYGAVAAADEFPARPRRASGVSQEKSRFRHEQWIIPSVLMTYGTIEASMGRKLRLLNRVIGGKITARPPAKIRVDDYLQYLPIASAYTLDLAGIRGRHNLLAKTEILGTATLFLVATVNGMKYTVRERRPDRSAANSFPSGHTAVAFMGAEFLRAEYQDVSAWYGIAGYLVAIETGVLRIYNNKHWVGDVAFGAGLGILCARAAYWLYPVTWERLAKKGGRVALLPFCTGQQVGISLALVL